MTTDQNATAPAALSVMAVMAEVVLWQAEHHLPLPTTVHFDADARSVDLRFTSRAEIDAWMGSMGSAEETRQQPYLRDDKPKTLHNGGAKRWGWGIWTSALVDDVPAVSDDTLAQLRTLAGTR